MMTRHPPTNQQDAFYRCVDWATAWENRAGISPCQRKTTFVQHNARTNNNREPRCCGSLEEHPRFPSAQADSDGSLRAMIASSGVKCV